MRRRVIVYKEPPVPEFPDDIDEIVFFGDSLTDAGAIFGLTSDILAIPFPLASAGYAGVLSNGPVYAQTLPGLIGADAENYAVGGARALGTRPVFEVLGLGSPTPPFDPTAAVAPLIRPDADPDALEFDINLGAQVGRFVTAPSLSGTVAASFLIGLNDVNALDPSSPTILAEAQALVGGILAATALAAQSARSLGGVDALIFYTFPGSGFFPAAAALSAAEVAAFDQIIAAHTAGIEAIAEGFLDARVPTTVVDLTRLSAEIDADPGTFGFLAKGPVLLGAGTNPQIGPPVPPSPLPTLGFPENPAVAGLDADRVQFWDFLHPTTALHDVIAVFSAAALTRDVVALGDEADDLDLSNASQLVLAGAGNDRVSLGLNDDVALGGLGDDTIQGNRDDDLISGGAGDDLLTGNQGFDVLVGGAGDDTLWGGGNADILIGGDGSDLLSGGRGEDVFLWQEEATPGAQDFVAGGKGYDTLYLARSATTEAVLADAVANRSALDVQFGTWDLDALGLTVWDVERVALYDSVEELVPLFRPEVRDSLRDADLWGFV